MPDRERRPHAARRGRATATGFEVLGPDARRRRRRGARQGRAPARARLPGRPGDRAPGARGRSRRVRVPGGDGARPRPRLQLQRPEDGARSTRSATSDEGELRARRADLAASYQAAVVGQLVAKLERALDGGEWDAVALGGGVAANALLRERAAELCEERGLRLKLVPAGALHRQRGDDRLGRPLPRADPVSRLPGLGRRCA